MILTGKTAEHRSNLMSEDHLRGLEVNLNDTPVESHGVLRAVVLMVWFHWLVKNNGIAT